MTTFLLVWVGVGIGVFILATMMGLEYEQDRGRIREILFIMGIILWWPVALYWMFKNHD